MRKGNILLLILVVLGIMATSIWGYFWWQKSTVFTPPASSTTSDSKTSDKILTIDFSTCQIEKKRVDVTFGSTTYEVVGEKSGICEVNYGGEVENPNWNGKMETSCQVPTSLGKVVFQKNDYGVDFSPIKNYCSSGSCKSNNDCVVGIEINTTCCRCPMVVNRNQIGKDGWEVYVKGIDYGMPGENCSKIACAPCPPLDFNPPVCSAGKCIQGTNLPVETEKFCGGISGIKCANGYLCKLNGNYPDAGGKCVKN